MPGILYAIISKMLELFMNSKELFALGLGLRSPWKIEDVYFKEVGKKKELHIGVLPTSMAFG